LLWNDQCYIIHNVLLTIAGLLCTLHASPSSLPQSFSLPGGQWVVVEMFKCNWYSDYSWTVKRIQCSGNVENQISATNLFM